MKFKVNREKLLKALQRVGNIVGSRPTLSICSNVLLVAKENELSLRTTDLELHLVTVMEAEVAEPGSTTLPARKLTGLIGSLSAAEVSFDVDGNDHAKIVCGTGNFTLLGLAANGFPQEFELESARTIQLREPVLKRMINSIVYAVSTEDSRKMLTGVLFNVRDKALTLVGTDGKRMALQESIPESVSGDAGDAIVPLKAMTEMRRLLGEDEPVTVTFSDKFCRFTTKSISLVSKLIDGIYPDFRRVVPPEFKLSIELPIAPLLAKIESVALMLGQGTVYEIFAFGDRQLKIQASSSDVGNGCEYMECDYSGDGFDVSFNPSFLTDPLRNTDAETVRFKINDPHLPVALECGEGFIYILMPVRKNVAPTAPQTGANA